MKGFLKQLIKKLPIAITQNQVYDSQTTQIIKKVCKADSNCIDVGAHKGEVLDEILKAAPNGQHFAFEPIPDLFSGLKTKYAGLPNCHVYDLALSNKEGNSTFNYVVSNPSYSGLIKRKYDREHEEDTQITVKTNLLDNILPADIKIDLIKIDVEGGEMLVLEGARKTIIRCQPFIIFEHGMGASDYYGTTPKQVFDFLTGCGLRISTMKRWLKMSPYMTLPEFEKAFNSNSDYYFIAYV